MSDSKLKRKGSLLTLREHLISGGSSKSNVTQVKMLSKKEIDELIKRVKKNDSTLINLSLAHQQLSNHHLNSLLDALQQNTTLKVINLSHNSLLDAGACELLNRLDIARNTAVRVIDIRNNSLTSLTGAEIIKYLSKHLHVTDIKFEDKTVISVTDLGVTNDKIFIKKPISKKTEKRIRELLNHNRKIDMVFFMNLFFIL